MPAEEVPTVDTCRSRSWKPEHPAGNGPLLFALFQNSADGADSQICFVNQSVCSPQSGQVPNRTVHALQKRGAGESDLQGNNRVETNDINCGPFFQAQPFFVFSSGDLLFG